MNKIKELFSKLVAGEFSLRDIINSLERKDVARKVIGWSAEELRFLVKCQWLSDSDVRDLSAMLVDKVKRNKAEDKVDKIAKFLLS